MLRSFFHSARARLAGALLGGTFLILVSGCGSTRPLASHWRDGAIKVDGHADEWEGVQTVIEKKNMTLGLYNDGEDLYVLVVTGDPGLQGQILGRGLTVWLDPAGGKDKVVGIRYPEGVGGRQGLRLAMAGRTGAEGLAGLWARLEPSMTTALILGPDEEVLERRPLSESGDIAVKVTYEDATLTYEMKLPLRSDRYTLGVETPFGLSLTTPKVDEDAMREAVAARGDRSGGRGSAGRGGRRGGVGGGRGGVGGGRGDGARGGGRGPQFPDPISVWVPVSLAAPSSPSDR